MCVRVQLDKVMSKCNQLKGTGLENRGVGLVQILVGFTERNRRRPFFLPVEADPLTSAIGVHIDGFQGHLAGVTLFAEEQQFSAFVLYGEHVYRSDKRKLGYARLQIQQRTGFYEKPT